MGDLTKYEQAVECLREVIRCKLRLWDAARQAEQILGVENVETGDELLGSIACCFDMVEDVSDFDAIDIIEEFSLQDAFAKLERAEGTGS